MNKKHIDRIQENSKKLVDFHKQWDDKKISTDDYFRYHEALALPGGLTHTLDALKRGNHKAIDVAIAFIHIDPHFFRSGYIKEKLLELLKKVSLSSEQTKALQELLLMEITKEPRRGYTAYCKLAQAIHDEDFSQQIKHLLTTTDNALYKEKAQMMLDMIHSRKS